MSTTNALRQCNKYVLKPYNAFLKVVGTVLTLPVCIIIPCILIDRVAVVLCNSQLLVQESHQYFVSVFCASNDAAHFCCSRAAVFF